MFLTLSEGPNDLREVTTIIIDITEIIEEIIANDLLSEFSNWFHFNCDVFQCEFLAFYLAEMFKDTLCRKITFYLINNFMIIFSRIYREASLNSIDILKFQNNYSFRRKAINLWRMFQIIFGIRQF